MSRCQKLLWSARNNPKGLRFMELCYLAECHGFTLKHQKGSHRTYSRKGLARPLSFQQGKNAMAKAYEVHQLLDAIAELKGEDDDEV
jgi:hypothetical protein